MTVLYQDNEISLIFLEDDLPIHKPGKIRRTLYTGYYVKLKTKNEWYTLDTRGALLRQIRYSIQRKALDNLL